MDKQILTQEIYKIIKQYIKESENPLIEDYIPASNLPEMQRDLVNRLEKQVSPTEAEPTFGKWISLADKLPGKGVEVLATDGKQITIDIWDDIREAPVSFSSQTICVGEGWESDNWENTHWMPLPKP